MSDLRSSYFEKGFNFPHGVLTPGEAQACAGRYADFQDRARAEFGAEQRFKAHLLVTWLDSIVHDPRILDLVETLIGPDILCWSSDFFVKPAQDPGFVSFHQDTTYAGIEPFDGIVNCWLALTPSRRFNGCLEVVEGSHKLGQVAHVNTHGQDNMLFYGQEAQLDYAPEQVIAMELDPGEMSMHHMAIVHGSKANNSDTPRMGVVLRYVSAVVRQTKGRDSATLVRGENRHDHFDLEPRPKTDWSPEAIAAFKDAVQRPSALG